MGKKTIDDLMREINSSAIRDNVLSKAPDTDDEQYSFAVPFNFPSEEAKDVFCGNCLLFSMTGQVARALSDMTGSIPRGFRSMEITMPDFLGVGVRSASNPEDGLTYVAKSRMDRAGMTDIYWPRNKDVGISVSSDGIAITLYAPDEDPGEYIMAQARFSAEDLLSALDKAAKSTPEDAAMNAERLFENQSAPSMSCR